MRFTASPPGCVIAKMASTARLALILLSSIVIATHAAPVVKTLEPFTAIRTCLPFNLLVTPSDDDSYSFTIDADKSIEQALKLEVADSLLTVTTSKGFNSTTAIKAWVSLPKDKLLKIEKSAAADLVVGEGFVVDQLDILVNGLGQLSVFGLTANDLVLENTKIAHFVVRGGKIKRARVSGRDTSTIYLSGVVNSVEVSLSGLSKLFVESPSDKLQISGRSTTLSRVFYNKGKCRVRGDLSIRPPCVRDKFDFPASDPLFSCGMLADGGVSCTSKTAATTSFISAGSSSSSSFSFGGGSSISRSFASSSSSFSSKNKGRSRVFTGISLGGGSFDTLITSRASTSSSGGSSVATSGFASASSSGGQAQAIAVVSNTCDVEDVADLKMLED